MFEKGSLVELFPLPVSDGVAHREEPPVEFLCCSLVVRSVHHHHHLHLLWSSFILCVFFFVGFFIFWEQVVAAVYEAHISRLVLCTKEADWLLNPLKFLRLIWKGCLAGVGKMPCTVTVYYAAHINPLPFIYVMRVSITGCEMYTARAAWPIASVSSAASVCVSL